MDENLENQNGTVEEPEEKLFTQAELDAILSKRVNAVKKGMPGADELAEFRSWKATHADADTQLKTITGERDAAQKDLESALADYEMARRENYLLRQGIPAEDVDYYVYRISKTMDGDTEFETAAKAYLKDHKRQTVKIDTGARLTSGSGSGNINDAMNALIRNSAK